MGNKYTESREALYENQIVRISDYVVIGFADTGVSKKIADLPEGAILLDVLVNVTTAFNASTTDYLDVGYTGTLDAYVADMDVASVAFKNAVQETSPLCPARLTADRVIYATYTGSGTAATTGSCQVSLVWAPQQVRTKT